MYIYEVTQGTEIIGWLRLGLALTYAQRGDTSVYLVVPRKPQRLKSSDISKFTGWVIQNDTSANVLTVQVTKCDHKNRAINKESFVADIHYSAFKRVRAISNVAFPGKPGSTTRAAIFKDSGFKPYKTLTEVKLIF